MQLKKRGGIAGQGGAGRGTEVRVDAAWAEHERPLEPSCTACHGWFTGVPLAGLQLQGYLLHGGAPDERRESETSFKETRKGGEAEEQKKQRATKES